MRSSRSCAGFVIVAALAARATGAPVDYATEIKPMLANRCGGCHSALRQKSGLRLDTAAGALAGGDSGPAIVPGHADQSLLMDAVRGTAGFRMPPEGEGTPLTEAEIALVARWIDEGAQAPADEPQPPDPRAHWAFQPPVKAPLPAVADPAWGDNPIDAFLAAEHQRRGLRPNPQADRRTLVRRVYVDLVGLLPTADEAELFLSDDSPGAYERLVDALLANPRHGPRWGRHWMDVWRYSDWYGRRDVNQHRNSRRHIWRWRDWIIASVAADKPYDRMIHEMLAGDELAPGDDDVMRATGLLGRNFYVYNRHVWLQDTVEHTAGAFLGLTFKCCRCHDHKYDPIDQDEYYGLRAFFEPHQLRVDPLPGRPEADEVTNAAGTGKESVLRDGFDVVFDADPAEPTYLLVRGNEKNPDTSRTILPTVPAVLRTALGPIAPVSQPVARFYPQLRAFQLAEALAALDASIAAAQQQLAAAEAMAGQGRHDELARNSARATLRATQARRDAFAARVAAEQVRYGVAADEAAASRAATAERSANAADAESALAAAELVEFDAQVAVQQAVEGAGDRLTAATAAVAAARKALDEARAALAGASSEYQPLGTVYARQSTGRRLALARWLTSADNPLTARVAANHVWMRHFGAPLVATVADFGLRSKPPTNPALLDWLACELVESGWSLKHLHRLIVTSRAYQLASTGNTANAAIDPENTYLWRANPRRLEAEVLRDGMLHLAGVLDEAAGGPDLDPATAETNCRRSVYFRHTPDDKPAMLVAFDAADPAECYRRLETVRPQQALALENGPLALGMARRIAGGLSRSTSDDAQFTAAAFALLLGRAPDDEERQACLDYLAAQAAEIAQVAAETDDIVPPPAADPHARAREGLVHVLLNHQDFLTIH